MVVKFSMYIVLQGYLLQLVFYASSSISYLLCSKAYDPKHGDGDGHDYGYRLVLSEAASEWLSTASDIDQFGVTLVQ